MSAKQFSREEFPGPRRCRRLGTAVATLTLFASGIAAAECSVYVPTGWEITINVDATTDCIYVATGGTLNVGAKLTLTGPGPSTVDGTVNLTRSTSELVFSTLSHTIAGSGEIHGQDGSADIYIPEGKTLTSTAEISGCLRIYGPGNFVNQGTVNANANGTLEIAVGGTVDDSTTNADRWIVSANGAKLLFDSSIGTLNTLDGNFKMTSGNEYSEILIEHSLTTNGRLQQSIGKVTIGPEDGSTTVTLGSDGLTPHHADISGTAVVQVLSGNSLEHK